jgi:predicted phage tail protein
MTKKMIKGAGGPPTPPTPYRAPDTLNSKQFATIQDLLSEGEIEGFATPSKAGIAKSSADYLTAAQKDIFLNDTAILNANASNSSPTDADFNFQSVVLDARFGTNNQLVIPGIESSDPVNSSPIGGFPRVCTVANGGVTQAISLNKDAVRVTISFGQLQKAEDNGDLLGSTVDLKIQLQTNNGTFTDKITDSITGRSADLYSKEYRVNLPATYSQAAIKVVRVTADSTDNSLKDEFSVSVMQEIVDDPQTYPDSAYAQLRIDSEQFSAIPKRAYRIRGIKVRIPAANGGLTPTVVANQAIATSLGLGTPSSFGFIHYPENYVFNGQMAAAQWCSCPAMILLDLLTTKRYGFGTHIAPNQANDTELYENLDLYSFVAASRYANELVNDGFSGQEPRFSCNVNIQSSKEAFDLIKDLASIMRCIPVWSQGSISIVQDKPTDPSYLFSLANVTPEGFSYTGSSLKQRHSVVSVSYFNIDSREMDFEVYGDGNTTAEVNRRAKLGIVYKQVKSFGCTSRGQAQRLARAIVFSEEQESEVINFATSMDAGAIVRPGSVIAVNDPVRQGDRRSGRIAAATTTQITVDDTANLESFGGSNKECSVIMPDGTVEKKACTVVGDKIDLTSALSTTPNVNSIWLLESDGTGEEPQTFRVVSVEEQDGVNYSISALAYRDDKYTNIESTDFPTLPARNISRLNELKPAPTIKTPILEEIVVVNNIAINRLLISWQPVAGVTQYQVQYRFQNTNWVTQIVFRPDIEIMNTQAGTYDIKVFSFNAAGQLSSTPSSVQFNAEGKTAVPNNVQNLTLEPVNDKLVRLRWDKSVDADVLHGGRVYIRHSNKTDGTGTFANSVDLVQAAAGNTTEAVVPALEGEYILKFRDDGERFSTGETSVILDLPDLVDTQVILTERDDDNNYPGTKTRTTTTSNVLSLTNPAATNGLTGTYDFQNTVDLGGVFSLNLKRILQTIGVEIGNTIESQIPDLPPSLGGPAGGGWDNYATNGNFDGTAIEDVNAQMVVRTTQTDPSSSPTYSSFNTFANGTFKGRGFQFRLNLTSENTGHNINVIQAGFVASFESRTERSYVSGSSTSTVPQQSGTSSSGLDVTFGKPFFVGTSSLGGANAFLPSVGITIQNASAGDYFVLSGVTGTGFNIKIKNGTNFIDKQFTFQAVGYGKGV